MTLPRLMLVTDRHRCRGRDLVELAAAAARGGAGLVVLRELDLDDAAYAALWKRLEAALPPGVRALVHGRPELARALQAGLHLPERAAAPPAGISFHGRSVHGAEAVARARAEGAAYLVAGTVLATAGKPGVPGIGLLGLRALCEAAAGLPVFAIGGMTPAQGPAVRAAGAHGAAAVGALLTADDPAEAASALASALH